MSNNVLDNVSRETLNRLEQYQALLVKWQKAVNLVGPKTIAESWERHFVDSAQLLPLIPNVVKSVADIGSGAGFPGLVLAMLNPEIDFHLVESDDKKCQFLRTVSRETNCNNITVHNDRVENIAPTITPDMVTARALASLDQLLKYSASWTKKTDFAALFLKGQKADEEIKEAQKNYKFDLEIFDSITDANAKILKIANIDTL